MASACGKASGLLRPASNDDALREREAYRYFRPLQDLLATIDRPSDASKPISSPDRALTAFAQLAAFRLGVRRTFISLIDRKYQYILAEGTKTLSLQKGTVDDAADRLCAGMTQFERKSTPCEYAAGLLIAPDLLVHENHGDVVVFKDLSQHVLFTDHMLVTEHPHGRFYAGVPIRSPDGYNIGVLCAMDDKPRDGLADTEVDFLKDMAMTIMDHLEMVRAKDELGRSQNMVQGLGQFVGGKASLQDWWSNVSHGQPRRAHGRSHRSLSAFSDEIQTKGSDRGFRPSSFRPLRTPDDSPAPSLKTKSSADSQVLGTGPFVQPTPLEPSARVEQAELATGLQEDSISIEVRHCFRRASKLIRESVAVDGATFLDASVGTFAGLVGGMHQSKSSPVPSSATSTMSYKTDESFGSVDDKRCLVLGNSLSDQNESIDFLAPMSERFLHLLLAKYPDGKIWSFDHTEEFADLSEETLQAAHAAEFVNRRGVRWRERRMIQKLFPGVRSLALVGIWDPHRSRWFAGSIIWTRSPTRILCLNELHYMMAFGQSIMSEIARIDVKMADKAKATFISSISHELRTPLHGIMGSSECLQGTTLDAFQSGLISTIETCGKTLLDTFDNLLSFAKINNLTNNSNHRRPSVPNIKSETQRNGVDQIETAVDLSILVEEVIDTAFAGNEFARVSPIRNGLATGGIVPANLVASPSRGLEAITVTLDYDTDTKWAFSTQAGGWIRVVLNLVGNSLKYTEAGLVSIRMEATPLPSVEFQDLVEVVLTITDTGRGMTEEFLNSGVFSPFVQEDPLSPGTGLGLSIVKQIITSMGGKIVVQSTKNEGTQIQVAVSMRRAEAPEDTATSVVSEAARILRGKRINMLVPEGETDETDIGELCKKWFATQVHSSPEPDDADIYIISKQYANAISKQLAIKPAHLSMLIAKPVVVMCKDFVSAHALKSSNSIIATNPCAEYLSQPVAPIKVAKTLIQCLERAAAPPSTARPNSPATRMLSQRPRNRRVSSNLSNTSFGSNPEVVLYTPMEEKSQDALMSMVKQSVEVNHKAENLEAQKQKLFPEVPQAAAAAPGISVLLVDDNSINLNLLATFMKKQRHAYDTATNGLEAFQAYQTASDPLRLPEDGDTSTLERNAQLKARAYDFVLMDINMPIMDGLESTRHMRAFERAKGLRPATIIALTGMASASAQQEAFASGVDVFLTKPVRLKELIKILEGEKP